MARTLSGKRVACLGVCSFTGAGPDRLSMVGFKLYFSVYFSVNYISSVSVLPSECLIQGGGKFQSYIVFPPGSHVQG